MEKEVKEHNSETIGDNPSDGRYLVFLWNAELFGVPILDVQEVVKFSKAKPVPYTSREFNGVVNLRGRIISVVDIASRFETMQSTNKKNLMLIMTTQNDNFVAVLIDEITRVHEFHRDQIDAMPNIDTKIPAEFLLGIGKLEDKLVHLIDLPKLVSSLKYTRAA